MNEGILDEIIDQLAKQSIKHGSCNLEVVFHDGRITHYVLSTSVRHNVQTANEKGGKK